MVAKNSSPKAGLEGAKAKAGLEGAIAEIPALDEVQFQLAQLYPEAKCELVHKDAFELLVATVLSAQTTDIRVNQVTPELFRRWPDVVSVAAADEFEVEKILHPLGMAAKRSLQIIGLSRQLLTEHEGKVPDDQEALEALPGVGRKTAHVVRGSWFGHSLLTVDTHVARLAKRLGWSDKQSPLAIEKDVLAISGAKLVNFTKLSHELILHGRRVCAARKPSCELCPLSAQNAPKANGKRVLCPQIGVAK